MQKSIYSLVLSDGVMAEIDRIAYLRGKNRSQTVNEILAAYVSYTTPEQRIRTAFDRISTILDGRESFRLISPPSGTLLSLGSALVYKYNPTVRYSVELFRDSARGAVGELRVSMRTRNLVLTSLLTRFYALFDAIENRVATTAAVWEDGRYLRPLCPRLTTGEGTLPPDKLGEALADYIRFFDASLKAFFANAEDERRAENEIGRLYARYINSRTVIL